MGACKRIAGDLFELRFSKLGGGIRIYLGIEARDIIILLGGGNKGGQDKDIRRVKSYWHEYKSAHDEE